MKLLFLSLTIFSFSSSSFAFRTIKNETIKMGVVTESSCMTKCYSSTGEVKIGYDGPCPEPKDGGCPKGFSNVQLLKKDKVRVKSGN